MRGEPEDMNDPSNNYKKSRVFGDSFNYDLDFQRVVSLRVRVLDLMADGRWRTKEQIRSHLRLTPECDIGRRLRDLRKIGKLEVKRFGNEHLGIFQYRFIKEGEAKWIQKNLKI